MTNVSTHARAASPLKGRPGGGPRSGRVPRGALAPIRSALSLGLAVVCAVLGFASTAHAEEQPAILKAYGLDWIERVREEAWPQPKAQRPVICLLDTGVAITPDTPADNPEGPIVARLSVEDALVEGGGQSAADTAAGLGRPQGGTPLHLHGTRMAAIIAAPRNGAGTVGVLPQGRIVSIRVTLGSDAFITPAGVVAGVRRCSRWSAGNGIGVAAVVMAESGYDQRPEETSEWLRAAEHARALGAAFVAAVGNDSDATVVAPSAVPGIVPVAAGNDAGQLCPWAKHGEGTFIVGPGCSSAGWHAGSSSATAVAGAVAAAYAMRHPSSTGPQRNQFLVGPSRNPTNSALNGAGLAALLSSFVTEERVKLPEAPTGMVVIADKPSPTQEKVAAVRLWRPSVVAEMRGRRVSIARRDKRGKGILAVTMWHRGKPRTWRSSRPSRTLSLVTPRPKQRIEVWVESEHGNWRSLSTRLRVRSR